MTKFSLIDKFLGYKTKPDITNMQARFLTAGSQNVIVNDGEKVESRGGYTLYGADSVLTTPILGSFEWLMSSGTEFALRSYDDELEVYYGGAWTRLKDSWSATDFQFATWWSSTESLDLLLFVNGDANIYEWSGGVATFASATINTITKQGTDTWAVARFLTAGTRKIVINGTEYTYTGGESTTTLTGVAPDPSGVGYVAGQVIFQAVRTNTNTPTSGMTNDLIAVLNNQVYVASLTRNTVFVSKNTSFIDYTYTTPRIPGEGALLTLDGAITSLFAQEQDMYIGAGRGGIFKTNFVLSSDNAKESLTVLKLKTGPLQAPLSHSLVAHIKNSVAFVTNQPTLDELGRIENVTTPQSMPLSDPIKPDFDDADFSDGHSIFWKNWLLVSAPNDGVVYIYDVEKAFWQPPQILPVRRFAIIGGDLYGHSADGPITYKLFDGRNDNTKPISFKAYFAYRNFGDRSVLKSITEYYTELYMTSNCTLTERILYDYKGSTLSQEYSIIATDPDIVFSPIASSSLGTSSLGTDPLGNTLEEQDELLKIRVIKSTQPIDFFEIQVQFEANDTDISFQILAHGPNARLSNNQPVSIKKN